LPTLREGLAARFRSAVRQAIRKETAVSVGGARLARNGADVLVRISARPLPYENEALLLVSFTDEGERNSSEAVETPAEASRVAQLERELDDTRKELESTIRELEVSNHELSALNQEALSINEEFRSTNEELETSREEFQSGQAGDVVAGGSAIAWGIAAVQRQYGSVRPIGERRHAANDLCG
jgi:two-component system, chemotaxis family, CheB/CheR fusion protein